MKTASFHVHFFVCIFFNVVCVHVAVLDNSLREHLFGQHIARNIVLSAVRAHFREDARPKKALALSFHGLSGTGKTYTSQFIINSLFEKGPKSKYAHFFTGRNHFSMESKTDIYKVNICASLQ
jgi:Cdc6-like AAA superfamily ATPase